MDKFLKIESKDSLNTGREKLNDAIDGSEEALDNSTKALNVSNSAVNVANQAMNKSNQTQQQLDTVIIESGTSDAETIQARGDYDLLYQRLDNSDKQLIDTRIRQNKDFRQEYYDEAVFVFSFDDGRLTDWERMKPISEELGVPFNISVICSSIDNNPNYMTTDQLLYLKNILGWGVGSHTWSHLNVNNITPQEIETEYKLAHDWLLNRGLDHDVIVYPYGATNQIARKIASKYYKLGINIVRLNLSNDIPLIDNLNVVRKRGLSQDGGLGLPTLAELKAEVDQAIENKQLHIFEDHSHYEIYDNPTKLNELKELIQYIKSKGAVIANFADAFEMKCNVIDIGERSVGNYYKLHRNGQVSTNDSIFYFADTDEFNPNDNIDVYPTGKITKIRFNQNRTGLPISSQCYAEIDKTGAVPAMWTMTLKYSNASNGTLVYYRGWNTNENDWGRWAASGELIGDSHFTTLPTANVSNRGRTLLVRGHNGHEDKYLTCMRKADGSYEWREIPTIAYTN